jgi:pterin-4a-carbinolamine dehydratase
VLNALESQLRDLRHRYEHHPSEHNRYQLVKLERLLSEWAPGSLN